MTYPRSLSKGSGRGSVTLSWPGAKACALHHYALLPFPQKAFRPWYFCLCLFPTKFLFLFSHLNLLLHCFFFSCDIFFLDLTNLFDENSNINKPNLARLVCNQTETPGHDIALTLLLFIFVKFSLNSLFKLL